MRSALICQQDHIIRVVLALERETHPALIQRGARRLNERRVGLCGRSIRQLRVDHRVKTRLHIRRGRLPFGQDIRHVFFIGQLRKAVTSAVCNMLRRLLGKTRGQRGVPALYHTGAQRVVAGLYAGIAVHQIKNPRQHQQQRQA